MNTEKKVSNMVTTAAFAAIICIMAVVPFLGYIPLGFMNATIIHVPVIVGAIILGPKYGGFLGLMFGITSLLKNTFAPNPTSFVFSPFVTISGFGGNGFSLIICLLPRILIGIVAYYVYKAAIRMLKWHDRGKLLSLLIAGVAGSLTNTLLVMNFIYLFFGKSYAAASSKAVEGLYSVIMGVICINGIPEAILAGFLTLIITNALFVVVKQ